MSATQTTLKGKTMTTATKMICAYATFKVVGDSYRVWVEAPDAGETGFFGYSFPVRAGYDALYTRIDVLCRQKDWELSRFAPEAEAIQRLAINAASEPERWQRAVARYQ